MRPDTVPGPARILRDVRISSPTDPIAVHLASPPPSAEDLAAAYERGRRDATDELRAGAEAAAGRAAAALQALAQETAAAHRAVVDDGSRAVIAAAIDVAEWVLRQPLSTAQHGLLERLREAATHLIASPRATVRVNVADAEPVRGWAAGAGVAVTVDEALRPGDAVLETDAGAADVSVAAALRVAAEMLGVDPGQYPA